MAPSAPDAGSGHYKTTERPATVDEMAMLVFKLVRALEKANASSDLQAKAVDYLKRKGLVRGPFRQKIAP